MASSRIDDGAVPNKILWKDCDIGAVVNAVAQLPPTDTIPARLGLVASDAMSDASFVWPPEAQCLPTVDQQH